MRPGRLLSPLLLAAVAAPALQGAADNGDARLFTTPEQRQRLDQSREGTPTEAGAPEKEQTPRHLAAPAEKPAPLPSVHLRGFVRRSNGPGAVWVNDGSTLAADELDGRIHTGRIDGSSVRVTLPDGRRLRLKPGQIWNPRKGAIVDAGGN
jgi:hypothetical protein